MRRIAVILALLVLVPSLTACGNKGSGGSGGSASKAGGSLPPAHCTYTPGGTAAKKVSLPPSTAKDLPTTITIHTDRGAIGITLDAAKAPCTVNSFVSLAKQGYFDNTHCHRLTTSGIFVLQCGDPTGIGNGGPGYSFDDELIKSDPRLKPCTTTTLSGGGESQMCTYPAGTVAMANAGPNTNGSQFFLVYKASPLQNAYTDFGTMDPAGLEVVRSVAAKGAGPADAQGLTAPNESVTISKVG